MVGVATPDLTVTTLNGVDYYKRTLSIEELNLLTKEMIRSPYMMALSPEKLLSNETHIAYVDGEFAGTLIFVDLGNGWWEFGPVYIMEKFRGKKILNHFITLSEEFIRTHHVFVCSHNEYMVSVITTGRLKTIGFRRISLIALFLPKYRPILRAKIEYCLDRYTREQKQWRKANFKELNKPDAKSTATVFAVYEP